MLKAKSANQMWHKHYFWKKGWPHPQLFVAAPQKLWLCVIESLCVHSICIKIQ